MSICAGSIYMTFDLCRTGCGIADAMEARDGTEYKIRTDYRVILRILRMLGDPEVCDRDKPILLRRMFYPESVPPGMEAEELFESFLRCGRDAPEPGGERDFDYEQDASEIYSAFYQTYRIDLLTADMHWYQFSALLNGCFTGENALSNKIRLRHLDDGKGQHKAALERQKRAVQLRDSISGAEKARVEQLRMRLEQGLPLEDLL